MQETKHYHVAIVGATTVLGHECLKILEQRKFPVSSLRLFASDKSDGRRMFVGHREVDVHEPNSQSFDYVNIVFNLLPEVDVFMDNGYTREEWKIAQETRKIMRNQDLRIVATAVRVPVYVGHSEAVHIEFTRPMSPADARRILAEAPGVKVQDDPTISLYSQPWAVAGTDEVFVGRVRQDTSGDNGLILWVVSDNTRKRAALNATQIAEEIIRHGLASQEV